MPSYFDTTGKIPYIQGDDTRSWAESYRMNDKIKPSITLRLATDTNYIMNQYIPITGWGAHPYNTRTVMNLALPGMRIPHVLNWSVNESLENPVQTANFEMINALSVSDMSSTISTTLYSRQHSPTAIHSYVRNSINVIERVPGGLPASNFVDGTDDQIPFLESNVQYRTFESDSFTVNGDISDWPNPNIPDDDDGNDVTLTYPGWIDANGAGSFFVRINQEVIRVSAKSGNTFYILPGGRAINGVLQHHNPGSPIHVLGYPGGTGENTGFGYASVDDFKPYKHFLRPGTCLVSYEGYGLLPSQLVHGYQYGSGGHDLFAPDHTKNYVFTGYWFVKGLESSLGEDMVPRLRVDLVSAGELFNKQKITPDVVQRMKMQFGQWRVEGDTIFGSAGHKRNVPGDWADFHSWDPLQKDAYPLKIKTEFAQHKEFYEHMRDTNYGTECEFCQQERKEFLRTHQDPLELKKTWDNMSPGAARDKLRQRINDLDLLQAKQIGRHIYKQSIRVMQEPGGPLKTYIRLIATMAAAAWDHPAYNTDLGQRFTKIPNSLFDNMRHIYSGLVYDGGVSFLVETGNGQNMRFQEKPSYADLDMINHRASLVCPFESTYDKTPFYQPMVDLADVNGNQFWIDRHGRPVFMPQSWPLRPYAHAVEGFTGAKCRWQWNMKYGGSISSYSHSINTDQVITQCWVTCTTAFDSTFTIVAGGTGFKSDGKRLMYSALGGNKDGLALTSGVQQVETISLDNQVLGLDWNTNPANFGIKQQIIYTDEDGNPLEDEVGDGPTMVLNAMPPLYDGGTPMRKGSSGEKAIKRIQKTINFFLIRKYLAPIAFNNKSYFTIYEDGNFGNLTEKALEDLQDYLINVTPLELQPVGDIAADRDAKRYGRSTYKWVKNYLEKIGKHFVATDIAWYVYGGRDWKEYVGALTGIKVPVKTRKGISKKKRTDRLSTEEVQYIIDDLGLQREVETWHRNFFHSAVNVGNKTVDNSINQATQRSIATNMADPRVQPGDVIWCEVPGHLTTTNQFGRDKPPFQNGIYITTISRQMDLLSGTYTGTYSGYRYRGDIGTSDNHSELSKGFNFFLKK